jgi:hypothetical protein
MLQRNANYMRQEAMEWGGGYKRWLVEGGGLFSRPLSMYMAWGSVEGFEGNIKWPDYKGRWNW